MQDMIFILTIIRTIDLQLYHTISEINFDPESGITLFYGNKSIPIVLGFDNYIDKLYNLYIFNSHMKDSDEFNKIKTIDVRFAGQIVTK